MSPTERQSLMAVYTLPELPYDYAALEPHISAKIMELHHDKHHAAYVAGANAALEQLEEARENGAYGNVSKLSKDLAFNLGGHTNHSIFWNNLSPEGGDKPTGELAAAIDEFFGSFDKFREHFSNVALTIQGSGWAIAYGIISILAGFVLLCMPIASTVWLIIFGGCAMIVMGVFAIIRAFTFGRVSKNAAN